MNDQGFKKKDVFSIGKIQVLKCFRKNLSNQQASQLTFNN